MSLKGDFRKNETTAIAGVVEGLRKEDRNSRRLRERSRTLNMKKRKKKRWRLDLHWIISELREKERVGDVHYAYSRLERDQEESLILQAIIRSVMTGWKRERYGA